ncbi:hypothetical protein MWN34_04975 [Ancylobacter sp. 6x-1]|uniref:Uncharacterized protein n=1 Tax=Ancylobacter crimeensis TaxID=2579147 RepID=A0ABT0D8H5_9HYPH|nr:hypothetical protein [Ancylobacter crimeensis]MCK0196261.1 hypothetical protein [Ancylobacter crimeensis]
MRRLSFRLALLGCLSAFAVPAAFPLAAQTASAAPAAPGPLDLFFNTPYLAGLPSGATLSYAYVHKTARPDLGDSFDETMKLSLAPAQEDAAKKVATVAIFRGTAERGAGPFPALGNPMTLVVLEREAKELTELSKGSPYYIRNRLRDGLASAKVEPTSFSYDGKMIDGWKMSMTPFASDPHKDQLLELIGRSYEFVFSKDVPGGLYAVKVLTPQKDGSAPMIETRVTLTGNTQP